MTLNNLLHDIGEDADLLIRSDEWLEQERRIISCEIDEKIKELEKLLLAQRIKRLLQQKNLVAVQEILRSANGDPADIIIKLMKLPDAIYLMEQNNLDIMDGMNAANQLLSWDSDGYDIITSRALRTA